MKKIIATTALVAAVMVVPAAASADEGCTTVDYQGAPLEMCPPQEPDPTNCYTGDYQGAPIEICMATGETLPPGTIDMATGEPPVIHNSKDYVAPVETPAPSPAPSPAPAPVAPEVSWLDELQAILVNNGGW